MVRKICSLFAYLTLSLSALPVLAQKSDEEARVTLTINPDGSETVYQKDAASHQAIAMTTGADGKPLRKIIYRLDNGGRYESGQVFGANGAFRFKTLYKYDATGRLAQETQRSKDDSIRRRIVYNYDASGNPAGYAVYDGNGKLLGRTIPKKPAAKGARPNR